MNNEIIIRQERAEDIASISNLIRAAFANHPFSDQREAEIVELMRTDNALVISLIATINDTIVGHISFSEVSIDEHYCNWYGLAPVSVLPDYQGQGIGSKLINQGLTQLKQLAADGCVLLGEPEYYQKFGFAAHSKLILTGVPAQYFQALALNGVVATGIVKYHSAFS